MQTTRDFQGLPDDRETLKRWLRRPTTPSAEWSDAASAHPAADDRARPAGPIPCSRCGPATSRRPPQLKKGVPFQVAKRSLFCLPFPASASRFLTISDPFGLRFGPINTGFLGFLRRPERLRRPMLYPAELRARAYRRMSRKRTTVLDPGVICAGASAMWALSSDRDQLLTHARRGHWRFRDSRNGSTTVRNGKRRKSESRVQMRLTPCSRISTAVCRSWARLPRTSGCSATVCASTAA